MKFTLCILAAIASMAMLAAPDRVSVRAATGRRFARVTAIVQPRAEHRALVVSGAVFITNEQGEEVNVWERVSGVDLDGDRARRQHVMEWLPAPGILRVRAETYGLCGSGEAVAMVGF